MSFTISEETTLEEIRVHRARWLKAPEPGLPEGKIFSIKELPRLPEGFFSFAEDPVKFQRDLRDEE